MNSKKRKEFVDGIIAILDANGDQTLFDDLRDRIQGKGRKLPVNPVLAGTGGPPGGCYVDVYRGLVVDEQTGKKVGNLSPMQPRECRFACAVVEATLCNSGTINVCELTVLQPTCLDALKDLNGVLNWVNTPLARIRTAMKRYGYTVKYVSRGEWKWAALVDVNREGVMISMEEEAERIKAAQRALNDNNHGGAVAHASAALKLYPESWQGQVILGRCGLLEGVAVDPELLTRTARFLHNYRLTIRKAIPAVSAWAVVDERSAPCPVLEGQIKIWETELNQHGELFDAAERFLRQGPVIQPDNGEAPTAACIVAIAKVWNMPARLAGRLAELKTICDHPELACLIHRQEELLGCHDLPARRSVRRACEVAVASLIKSFDSCPTVQQLVSVALEKLEPVVVQVVARQPRHRDGRARNFLPEDIEPGPDGVWREKHNPRRRPRRKRDDY